MSLDVVIRPADADDFGVLAQITNHYIATSAIHFAYEPITAEAMRTLWSRHAARHPWFVAEHGQIVGYAKSGPWRDRAAYAWTCEIGVYVAADARGRRVGLALYEALLAELPARGFRSAVAGITLPNDASLALHEKLGFEHVGTFRDAGWKHGAWHAVDFWQKRFTTGPEGPAR